MQATETLKKVRRYYENALQSNTYQKWLQEARNAWAFYDGQQWGNDEITALKEKGQPPIVINKIAPKVDNIAGTEIAGRTRVVYRSRSGELSEEETAKALSDLALYVAERNDQAIEISNMFKAGLVTGIGWLDTGVEQAEEGPFIFNRHENELHVIWDPAARRMDYSDARFVCRERWIDGEEAKHLFPDSFEKILKQRQGNIFSAHEDIAYFNSEEDLFRVVEVQYKQTEKLYRAKTDKGATHTTFSKDEAYSLSNNVESTFAPRTYIAYFSGDTLLQNSPTPYKHNGFTLVPYIFKRERKDGRPYGLVRTAIDPQRELNKRRSKAMHLLNTAQVIADIDAVEDPNTLAREAARPDGLILKRPGKDLRILRNSDLASSQVSVMEQASLDIQDVMGVFDEAIGKKSNATSGVAIQTRQMASTTNQMFAFDALRRSKKALGMAVLSLIRQFFTGEMTIQITDNLQAPRIVRLNTPATTANGDPVLNSNGEPVRINDVRAGVFDIVVEEVSDALSSRELELNQLNLLMQAGVPIPPEMLVEASSLRRKDDLLKRLQQTQESKD